MRKVIVLGALALAILSFTYACNDTANSDSGNYDTAQRNNGGEGSNMNVGGAAGDTTNNTGNMNNGGYGTTPGQDTLTNPTTGGTRNSTGATGSTGTGRRDSL
jgi:hypothetical protein